MYAAWTDDADLSKKLIEHGAKLDLTRDADSRTALSIAAQNAKKNAGAVLIDAGADPNAKSEDGRTALSIAESNDSDAVAKLLKRSAPKADGKSS
jgi:ankyrin repeat protein